MFSRIVFFVTCLHLSAVLIKGVHCYAYLDDEDYSDIMQLLEEFLEDDDNDFEDWADIDPIIFQNKTYDLRELALPGLRGIIDIHYFKFKGFSDVERIDAYDNEGRDVDDELVSIKALFPLLSYDIFFTLDAQYFGTKFCKIVQFKIDLENHDINLNSLTMSNAATMLYHIKHDLKINAQYQDC